MNYYEYDEITGEIVAHHSRPDSAPAPDPVAGHGLVLTTVLGGNKYIRISDEAIMDKQLLNATWNKTIITADGVDTAVLSGLPNPCTVKFDGVSYIVTDGMFELASTTIGNYQVAIDEVEYLAESWEIEAI